MEILYLIIGIVIGLVVGYLILRTMSAPKMSELLSQKNVAEQKSADLAAERQKLQSESEIQNKTILSLTSDLSRSKTELEKLGEKLSQQKAEVEELQQKFTTEFRNLANEILEEKSKKFTEQNKTNIDEILKPLQEKIKDFEKKVDDTHKESIKDTASLKEQIAQLHKLNQTIGEEAKNLVTALKGQTKSQGNWGEMILLNILEKSGLERDREYLVQESHQTQEGRRLQPDVIVLLPDGKKIVIDSKVSLVAYEMFSSSDDETIRRKALSEHLSSTRNHIKSLSLKNYQNLYDLNSLDFVFMFVPIEPALTLAMQTDPNLYNEAYDKNIVMVSPSILMAALRLIANIWRQEKQNRNAIEIAKQSGDLYDKFVSFMQDLIEVGRKMDASKSSYEEAMKKLYDGRGNIIRRIEDIRQLGAKATKQLPQNIVDRATE